MSSPETAAVAPPISLPQGGGALRGMGEKFSPDPFTGSSRYRVPIALPPGRHGLQPVLVLGYGSGQGQGAFGLGWSLDLPAVQRKLSHGVPRYDDGAPLDPTRSDQFVLSAAEDLVPMAGAGPGRQRYRPRAEGLFARIERVGAPGLDHWEIRTRDGLLTRYGMPRPADAPPDWRDPAACCDPADPRRVFAWHVSETVDSFGNRVRYEYLRDAGDADGHRWDQPLLRRIAYADYGDPAAPAFLVTVEFDYEPRPDAFSDGRAGFERRTSLRCRAIRVTTHAEDGIARPVRELLLHYAQAAFNGASLLVRVELRAFDDAGQAPAAAQLPPLLFGYAGFAPEQRRFEPVTGRALPLPLLADPDTALVDLRGGGLPDLLQLGAAPRWWANLGGGRFDGPRPLGQAPQVSLQDEGVALVDIDGDGRTDLLVQGAAANGYYPQGFGAGFSSRAFQSYARAPGVSAGDPALRRVDLDGDGIADLLHAGSRLRCWFNDPDPAQAWRRMRPATAVQGLPTPDFSDPRWQLADMNGDGLDDLVHVHSGHLVYWPNLGHGHWGAPVRMRQAPRLPHAHDPTRLLLADVDGDGLADLLYVDDGRLLLWPNRGGDAFADSPVVIHGTPRRAAGDRVRIVDLYGRGTAGVLWSPPPGGADARAPALFLDLVGGTKPGLLVSVDNQIGARTMLVYRPSTEEFLRDARDPGMRWRTPLPFPVQVLVQAQTDDLLAHAQLVQQWRYHHGYWDGEEREFRGFARVDRIDGEHFDGGAGDARHFSPSVSCRSWFHLGPVGGARGAWQELDLQHEYAAGDAPRLARPAAMQAMLSALSPSQRRDAWRTLRGSMLRSEVYGQDGSARAALPYTVAEWLQGVRHEEAAAPVFFAFALAERETQWERGDEPKTRFAFYGAHDAYGQVGRTLELAVPRGRDPAVPGGAPLLAVVTDTEWAQRDDIAHYLVDRVARVSRHELLDDGGLDLLALRDAAFAGTMPRRLIEQRRHHYDGPAFEGLPLGLPGAHGMLVRSEALAFEDAFLDQLFDPAAPGALAGRPPYLQPGTGVAWPSEYPPAFRTALPARAGYLHYTAQQVPGSPGGYYVAEERRGYDFQQPSGTGRGLLLERRDALGAPATMVYDPHGLLPVRCTDAAGLVTEARYDWRMLLPCELIDPNGTCNRAQYGPDGRLLALHTSHPDGQGDANWPSLEFHYDLQAFRARGQPVQVRTRRRVHHDGDADAPPTQRDDAVESVAYSDGFGRLLQRRSQAADTLFGDPQSGGGLIPPVQGGPSPVSAGRTRTDGGTAHVLVSGWQVYDNQGRVVEAYEPFHAVGWDYEDRHAAPPGLSLRRFYDALGRVQRTLHPDGSQEWVVFGVPADLAAPERFTPTPWERYHYDRNDNAGRTHAEEAAGYAAHWNTPSSTELDALGRTVRSVERGGPDAVADALVTRTEFDIQGNVLRLVDPIGREAMRCVYDLAGRRWRADSLDAGRRDSVLDALGRVIEARDSKAALVLQAFDLLQRPVRVWARDARNHPVTLRQRLAYGDGGRSDQPAAERAAARSRGLLGQLVQHHDEAGLVTVERADLYGRPLDGSRRVIADAPLLAAYAGAASRGWKVQPFVVDWEPRAGQTLAQLEAAWLENAPYRTSTRYDALGRVAEQRLPQDAQGHRALLQPQYDRAGRIERLLLDGSAQIAHMAYDARGRCTLLAYGNGVMVRNAYDPARQHLVRRLCERYTSPGAATFAPRGAPLQDTAYGHDLAGNLVARSERAPGCGMPGQPDALDRMFAYDALYRLVSASGRETDLPPDSPPWLDTPRSSDLTRTRRYTQHYAYDALGNLQRLEHRHAGGGYTRQYAGAPNNNRLHRMQVAGVSYPYAFDANGNLRAETISRQFEWNHADRLKAYMTQAGDAEPSVHAQYLYDAGGRRVKKLVRRQGGAVEVRHYLDDAFEHARWDGGEHNLVLLRDGARRLALLRSGPALPGDTGPATQFHVGDGQGSGLVLDGAGELVSREEYASYGETTFGSFAKKRYRFAGMERDEESGASYHQARYYLAHLARWASADPIGPTDAPSLYRYARSNPMSLHDPGGMQPQPSEGGGPDPEPGQACAPLDESQICGTARMFDGPPAPGQSGEDFQYASAKGAAEDAAQASVIETFTADGWYHDADGGWVEPLPKLERAPDQPFDCATSTGVSLQPWKETFGLNMAAPDQPRSSGQMVAKFSASAKCESTLGETRLAGIELSAKQRSGAELALEVSPTKVDVKAEAKLLTFEAGGSGCFFLCLGLSVEAGAMLSVGAGYGVQTGKASGSLSLPLVKAKATVGVDVEGIEALERKATRGVLDLFMPSFYGN